MYFAVIINIYKGNMSLIISCVFAVIMTVRMERTQRDRNIIHMYYIFVSAVMALCGLLSGPDGYMVTLVRGRISFCHCWVWNMA